MAGKNSSHVALIGVLLLAATATGEVEANVHNQVSSGTESILTLLSTQPEKATLDYIRSMLSSDLRAIRRLMYMVAKITRFVKASFTPSQACYKIRTWANNDAKISSCTLIIEDEVRKIESNINSGKIKADWKNTTLERAKKDLDMYKALMSAKLDMRSAFVMSRDLKTVDTTLRRYLSLTDESAVKHEVSRYLRVLERGRSLRRRRLVRRS